MSYGRTWDTIDQIEHPHLILPHYTIKGHFYINSKLGQLIKQLKKSEIIIVTQYASISSQIAMYYSGIFKKKFIFWSESIEGVAYEQNPLVKNNYLASKFRSMAIFPIDKWAIECWAIGTKAVKSMAIKMPNKVIKKYFYYSNLKPFMSSQNKVEKNITNFTFLGSAIYRKGFDILIDAVNVLNKKGINNFKIQVFGKGPLLKTIPSDLQQYFVLHGFLNQTELKQQLQKCNALVFPSRYDGWALAVIESLAMGLICIVSSQTGAKEAIKDGYNGWVLKENSSSHLADKMLLLITNKFKYNPDQIKKTAIPFNLNSGVLDFKSLIENI